MKNNTSSIRKVNGGYIVETVIPASTIVENVCTDFDSLVTFLRSYYKVQSACGEEGIDKPADTLKDVIESEVEFTELDDGLYTAIAD